MEEEYLKSNYTLLLNHKSEVANAHPSHKPNSKKLKIKANDNACGEDDPIFSMRLEKYDWKLVQEWDVKYLNQGYTTNKPEIWNKTSFSKNFTLFMERSITGFDYREKYYANMNDEKIDLNAEWAEWDRYNHRIIFAKKGKLFVYSKKNGEQEIQDLNHNKPEQIEAPKWAKEW